MSQTFDDSLLKTWQSEPRAGAYRAMGGDMLLHDLIVWNSRLAGSLMADISHVEVALRNLISQALAERALKAGYAQHWLADPSQELSKYGGKPVVDAIERAISQAKRAGDGWTYDDVVAELTLSFWEKLLSKSFVVFAPDLIRHFGGLENRNSRTLAKRVRRMVTLRNRVAHQHRIIHRSLEADWMTVRWVARSIDQRLEAFVIANSTFAALLGEYEAEANSSDSQASMRSNLA